MRSSGWLAALIQGIERLYPKSLADTSWDNVGLLLESPVIKSGRKRVLLAIDLTTSVADEALGMYPPVGAIIVYRKFYIYVEYFLHLIVFRSCDF